MARPLSQPEDVIETAMWCLALEGGSPTRAVMRLREQHGIEDVSRENIRDWSKGRFRARYEEIRSSRASEIEELVAANALERAIAMDQAEDQALRQVQAGLSSANGVEASMILRNLTQSKAANIDKAGQLRGRASFSPAGNGFEAILKGLQNAGLISVESPVDATVVDEPLLLEQAVEDAALGE
jgi:hypothetical protein